MKKLILVLLFITFLFAGDWNYQNMKFSGGYTASIDTIENFYSYTYEVGNGKLLPTSFTITHILQPDTSTINYGDSVDCVISLDFTNDGTYWYSYGNIDTIDLDSATVAGMSQVIGKATITTIPDYRYFRAKITSNTVDTFSVKLQKSVEF
ncbi:MAG: hypothetical protein U9N54_11880 [candidate division Zixibacteria bacterium]|nr:hypothetical protein [candidate division Zixibacteria bacterium]